jgi:A/G-specific adenine glycosylase
MLFGRKPIVDFPDTAAFRSHLIDWYREHRRDLPWRRTNDPYAIMVSELMLQQTQVKTVIPYFERFMSLFPTPQALSQASDETLLNAWQGLGYYRRARHLREAAAMIVELGGFPTDKPGIDALKGVGAYTSAAIASIAFELPHACVDGNVIRVITRLLAIDDDVTTTKTKKAIQVAADRLLDPASPGDFNQAMMELGATVCSPKKPSCMTCPVKQHCASQRQGDDPTLRPFKTKKVKVQRRDFRSLLLASQGRILLARRPDQGLMAGMWELPTQFAESFESWPDQFTELPEHVTTMPKPVIHKFTHIHASYTVEIYRARELLTWQREPDAYAETAWFTPEQLHAIPITKVLGKVLAKVTSPKNEKDFIWNNLPSNSPGQQPSLLDL